MKEQHEQGNIDGRTQVKVTYGDVSESISGTTEESPCVPPVQQNPTSLTPNALTMKAPSTHVGNTGYRPPSFLDQGNTTVTVDLIPAPTAIAANVSFGGAAALPERLPVQPKYLCPMGSDSVPRHFVSQPTIRFPIDSSGYDHTCRDDSDSDSDSPARQLRGGIASAGSTKQPSPRRPTPKAELPSPSTASSIITMTVGRRWLPQEDNRLIRLVQLYGVKWAKIVKEDMELPLQPDEMSIEGRTRTQLRDRARDLRLKFYRTGEYLPPNFDEVRMGKIYDDRLRRYGNYRSVLGVQRS